MHNQRRALNCNLPPSLPTCLPYPNGPPERTRSTRNQINSIVIHEGELTTCAHQVPPQQQTVHHASHLDRKAVRHYPSSRHKSPRPLRTSRLDAPMHQTPAKPISCNIQICTYINMNPNSTWSYGNNHALKDER